MNAKHTPGPWREDHGCIFAGEVLIANYRNSRVDCDKPTASQIEANAKIGAAGPDMLALLKDISLAMRSGGMRRPKDWQERIEYTIAKATGQEG